MASILNVDQINNAAGTSALTIDSSGNVQIPGHVIQVVEDSTTTEESTTSTSSGSQKISALSVNITPTSTSSKILVLVSLQTYNNTNAASMYANLFKDGSQLTSAGNAIRHYIAGNTAVMSASFNYLDSPATTSQITYDIRYYVSGGTGYISVNSGQSSITVMEIAG